MTKTKKQPKETHKFWTIELNIGSKRNMGKWNRPTTKRSHGYYNTHDLNTVREKVKNRFDGGGGNVIKAMFEYDGRYNDSDEKSFYISFTFYGGVDYVPVDETHGREGKTSFVDKQFMSLDSRRVLEDKLTILCMELEQECIGYNIREWEPNTMYPVGKSDLIYHPNFTGDQMIFDEEYFITYGHHQLNNRLTKLNNKIL